MFAALVNHWIDTDGIEFTAMIEDVEHLNEWAGASILDVTKMSFNRSLSLGEQYQLLSSGAALGVGCGPLLIANEKINKDEILTGPIALPGEWTTAHLLFNLFYPGCEQKEFHLFSEIEELVLSGEVAAGVIIHENRFTYAAKGLKRIADLGEEWENKTGLPIPLGGIFAHTRLDKPTINKVDELIRKSIAFANTNTDTVMQYVKSYAQEMDEAVMQEHIALYVNDYSLDLGETGRKAVHALKKLAQ